MSRRTRLSQNDPSLEALRKAGRIKKGKRNRRTLEDIISQQKPPENKGIEAVIKSKKKGSKFGNKPVSKDDPTNPFDIGFPSKGEFNFALALLQSGIPFEMQVNLGETKREFLPGIFLKPFKITVDFYLPTLNTYVDFKGALTDRALWQFRKKMEDWRLSLRPEDRPFLCVVNSDNANEFIILAKRGRREDLKLFLFDLK